MNEVREETSEVWEMITERGRDIIYPLEKKGRVVGRRKGGRGEKKKKKVIGCAHLMRVTIPSGSKQNLLATSSPALTPTNSQAHLLGDPEGSLEKRKRDNRKTRSKIL